MQYIHRDNPYSLIYSPIVGIVVTISPSFNLYRIVVLPAASRPTGRIQFLIDVYCLRKKCLGGGVFPNPDLVNIGFVHFSIPFFPRSTKFSQQLSHPRTTQNNHTNKPQTILLSDLKTFNNIVNRQRIIFHKLQLTTHQSPPAQFTVIGVTYDLSGLTLQDCQGQRVYLLVCLYIGFDHIRRVRRTIRLLALKSSTV